jgi:hypothetical protein
MIPVSRVVTNRVGSANHFRPLPSAAQGDASRLSYPQSFAGRVPGKVLANEVVLTAQAIALDPSILIPTPYLIQSSKLDEVLNLSLPVPMPCALVLGAYLNVPYAFGGTVPTPSLRAPTRFPGFAINTEPVFQTDLIQGVFVVEWGVGEARNYTVVDLAPCSLQIPVCQALKVSAYFFQGGFVLPVPGSLAIATASAYPGEQHPSPDATLTLALTTRQPQAIDTLTQLFALPPFAREWSAGIGTETSPPLAKLRVAIQNFGIFGTPPIGAWNLVATDPTAPFAATPAELPSQLFAQPLPGGAQSLKCFFLQLALSSGTGAYVTTKVRI